VDRWSRHPATVRRAATRDPSSRAYGRIASLPPLLYNEPARFVVLLERKRTVVVCSEDRKGTQRDFAGNGEGA
jgi:hypothetical protein